jgi:hypothetical protein
LANAAGPLDPAVLVAAAIASLPKARRNNQASSPVLHVGIAGGPIQRILRPAELESPKLADAIHQQALFVEPKLFSKAQGVDTNIDDSALVLEQERGARIQLSEDGSLSLRLPLGKSESSRGNGFGFSAVIEEDVSRELATALEFSAWLLDKIDPTQRITHVAIAASIEASDYMGWRTQAEQDASPNSGSMRMGNAQQLPISSTDRPRPALRFEAAELADDLMVRLRRQMKS